MSLNEWDIRLVDLVCEFVVSALVVATVVVLVEVLARVLAGTSVGDKFGIGLESSVRTVLKFLGPMVRALGDREAVLASNEVELRYRCALAERPPRLAADIFGRP